MVEERMSEAGDQQRVDFYLNQGDGGFIRQTAARRDKVQPCNLGSSGVVLHWQFTKLGWI
jgi:hypothetical protein